MKRKTKKKKKVWKRKNGCFGKSKVLRSVKRGKDFVMRDIE